MIQTWVQQRFRESALRGERKSDAARAPRPGAHGSDRHAAPACSKAGYVVSTRIDGRRQRHGNVMASVRIVDRFQDTAGVQEPRRGEIFR